MSAEHSIGRRDFLKGRVSLASGPVRYLHIASAVVTAHPKHCREIAERIAAMPETVVHAIEGSKIVVVMESENHGEIGCRLTQMALMERVFSANLVFEQLEPLDADGAE